MSSSVILSEREGATRTERESKDPDTAHRPWNDERNFRLNFKRAILVLDLITRLEDTRGLLDPKNTAFMLS